jgi:hypothetical protein
VTYQMVGDLVRPIQGALEGGHPLPHPLPLTPEGASDPGKEVFGLVRGAPGLEGNADESLGRLQAFRNKESF